MLYVNSRVRTVTVIDGLSNTLLVGERPPSADLVYGWWFAGAGQSPPYFGATDVVLGSNELTNPGSGGPRDVYRDGAINFLFADGSVHYLSYSIGQPTFQALSTRNGGEPIGVAID